MGLLDRFREWWDNLLANRGGLHYSIRLDSVGVSQMVRSTKGVDDVRLEWSQVSEVYAYKRDWFIWIRFELPFGARTWVLALR